MMNMLSEGFCEDHFHVSFCIDQLEIDQKS